ERRLREILAVLVERELGLRLPVARFALEALELAADLLLVGDRARGGGADLDQRVLHLLDHQPHELLRILGLVEDRVDVRTHDVAEARKDTHDFILLCRFPDNRCDCPWHSLAATRPTALAPEERHAGVPGGGFSSFRASRADRG